MHDPATTHDGTRSARPPISVVIPAHDEERGIASCLEALLPQLGTADEVVVVCNGCSDETAAVAACHGVAVVEIPVASKVAALNRGDREVSVLPRLYLDADVVLGPGAVDAVVRALGRPGVELAAPALSLDVEGCSPAVRRYASIWSRLPSVRDAPVSRGAYALSASGRARFAAFPDVLADDHYVRDVVPAERVVICSEAASTVRLPAHIGDVVRRRRRTVAGNAHLDGATPHTRARARRRRSQWLRVVADDPSLLPAVPTYALVAIWPRVLVAVAGARGRPAGWGRDESSRVGARPGRAGR